MTASRNSCNRVHFDGFRKALYWVVLPMLAFATGSALVVLAVYMGVVSIPFQQNQEHPLVTEVRVRLIEHEVVPLDGVPNYLFLLDKDLYPLGIYNGLGECFGYSLAMVNISSEGLLVLDRTDAAVQEWLPLFWADWLDIPQVCPEDPTSVCQEGEDANACYRRLVDGLRLSVWPGEDVVLLSTDPSRTILGVWPASYGDPAPGGVLTQCFQESLALVTDGTAYMVPADELRELVRAVLGESYEDIPALPNACTGCLPEESAEVCYQRLVPPLFLTAWPGEDVVLVYETSFVPFGIWRASNGDPFGDAQACFEQSLPAGDLFRLVSLEAMQQLAEVMGTTQFLPQGTFYDITNACTGQQEVSDAFCAQGESRDVCFNRLFDTFVVASHVEGDLVVVDVATFQVLGVWDATYSRPYADVCFTTSLAKWAGDVEVAPDVYFLPWDTEVQDFLVEFQDIFPAGFPGNLIPNACLVGVDNVPCITGCGDIIDVVP